MAQAHRKHSTAILRGLGCACADLSLLVVLATRPRGRCFSGFGRTADLLRQLRGAALLVDRGAAAARLFLLSWSYYYGMHDHHPDPP
jgi:hypothetical protein